MEVFKDYAYYYNSFYKDKDYKAEAEQVSSLLKKYGNNVNSVINFGCGTGRHDVEFHKMGYRCAGIDISGSMIDVARENAKEENRDIDFRVADICDFMPDRQYDAVISLFHVMSYQTKNQDILNAFRTARKAVSRVFLFDAWYGPGVLTDKPNVRVKRIEDETNELIRIARPVMHDKENTVDVSYEVYIINKETGKTKVINETHCMRYFFKPELELLLAQAGFELIDNLDCRTLKETDYNSWTSYFIAKPI